MQKDEWQVPNLPEYRHIQMDWDEWRRMNADFKRKKKPTSVALSPGTIIELKARAMKRGIPYQVLMRSFILRGLDDLRIAEFRQAYRARRKKSAKKG
jgi:predicted DNA binding CopG/RHH family protein